MIDNGVHDAQRLRELQSLPLERKIQITQTRIIEFVQWNQRQGKSVHISFSGGKDSTVLLHIARQIYPEITAVYVDTGLEYPEIKEFVKKQENVVYIKPVSNIRDVITEFGYPLISKDTSGVIYETRKARKDGLVRAAKLAGTYMHNGVKSRFCKEKYVPMYDMPIPISDRCCYQMKKRPIHQAEKENGNSIVGTMAEESEIRRNSWIKNGCNSFNSKSPKSQPMSFWKEQDVLLYIKKYGIEIASVYGDIVNEDGENQCSLFDTNEKLHCTGCRRTGCVACAYGFHLDRGETRFQRLAWTHPKIYDYCLRGGKWIDNPNYLPEFDGKVLDVGLKAWNPKKIWVPEKGLGLKFVFDAVNEIYGKDFYRYE